ncbi:MAG: hypothetical protein H7Z76_07485 [Methylotenera sp.]|nr:hypothetical protein [Flavobacterium sp.]
MEEKKILDKYGKAIKVSNEAYDRLQKVADSYGLNLKKTADGMINYFYVTGEDPLANRKDNMVKSMKQLQNTVVSFIREHETRHLEKIVGDFEMTRRAFSEKMETLPNKQELTASIKKLTEFNSESKEDISKIRKITDGYFQKMIDKNDYLAKREGLKRELATIIKEAESRPEKEGLFTKTDFKDLVTRLKTSVDAIR